MVEVVRAPIIAFGGFSTSGTTYLFLNTKCQNKIECLTWWTIPPPMYTKD